LQTYFDQYLQNLGLELDISRTQVLSQIKTWYGGYSWNAKDSVVSNPFSLLNLFAKQQFENSWLATETSTFLKQLLKKMAYDVTRLENKKVSRLVFESYNLDNMNIVALLFQTGYLTITHIGTQDFFSGYTWGDENS
jgi:hypothetical protein